MPHRLKYISTGEYARTPGTAAADFAALNEQMQGQAFLGAIQQMRGMGALSDAEGKAAEAVTLLAETARSTNPLSSS